MQTRLDFMSVQVRELDVSREFYTRALGFELAEQSPPGAAVFRDARGATFALRSLLPRTDPAQAFGVGVSLWFAVDIGAAHARVLAGGGRALTQPGPFGPMFVVQDPDGYQITLYQP
ncbi:VOC family protein [Deinococcus petrolearius]|uniref:VOC family protein n=1 Tax=Deinococcus petrolearius TaxID=1751295 RepID=A0ABW1DGR3_9DEIO